METAYDPSVRSYFWWIILKLRIDRSLKSDSSQLKPPRSDRSVRSYFSVAYVKTGISLVVIVIWYLNLTVIYTNSVVTVVLHIVFYQVKLNLRSKRSVIFQFLVS